MALIHEAVELGANPRVIIDQMRAIGLLSEDLIEHALAGPMVGLDALRAEGSWAIGRTLVHAIQAGADVLAGVNPPSLR